MNGKIVMEETKSGEFGGFLVIDRPQGTRSQYCQYQQGNVRCGDWCPHFGEPRKKVRLHFGEPLPTRESDTILGICNGKVLTFEEFTDERVK